MRTTFLLEPVIADRPFTWTAQTTCLDCGRQVTVRRGQHAAVLRCGNEVVGVMCEACLAPESLRRLAQLRGQVRGDDAEAVTQ